MKNRSALPDYGILPNPALKPEQARTLEAGCGAETLARHRGHSAMYFNTLYHNQITTHNANSISQYINLNQSLAHGAELELSGRISRSISVGGTYFYTSTQILTLRRWDAWTGGTGDPLLFGVRSSRDAAAGLYGKPLGSDAGGESFIGRRTDSDFLGYPVPTLSLPGYARVDASGYYQL